jgi:hypothetical protein
MSLQNAQLVWGPTSIAATGGTGQQWGVTRINSNQVQLGCSDDTDSRLRKYAEFKTTMSRPLESGANGFSQNRSSVDFTVPKLLSNGKYTKNAMGAYLRFDPETTDAERKNNRYLLAMALVDSDLDAFWDNQSNA